MEMNQYLVMFIDESKEHLQALNDNLLSLEGAPNDIGIVQNIFRSAHTLKGMSATMGFGDLASLTHVMENVLDLVRNNQLQMSQPIFDTLFRSLDALESMVNEIIAGGTGQADVKDIVAALKAIETGDYSQVAATEQTNLAVSPIELDEYQFSVLQQSIELGHAVLYIEVALRDDCVLKAARAYMVFDLLEQNGEIVKSSPSVQELEQEKFDRVFSLYYISQIDPSTIENLIMNVSEIQSAQITSVDSDSLQQLLITKHPTAKAIPDVSVAKHETAAAASVAEQPSANPALTNRQASTHASNRTIRVDIERLDTLMNLFSEMLIDRVRLEQLAGEIRRSDLSETVEHMSRVSADLQNIVLKLRMVPVESVFNRFPRMIRDLAKSLDKKVDLVITGADTELDRTVVDEIGDPLVHLLRNALDHGIEPVADRIAAQKPEMGTIYLRAFHSGNHVFIEIEEDGRGINREKVLQTALRNGIITPEEARSMSDNAVYQLLFASGFSTADKISDISGRGVGLDVVKTKISSLGGHVDIDSKPGAGTKFSVQLPLTLSIISAMLVRVGMEKYAIPLTSIVETSIVRQEEIRRLHGASVINYRSHVIPIISLSELFDCPQSDEKHEEMEIVIIRKGEKTVALIVDEFIAQQEIVLKSLGQYLTRLFAVSGATILGDGQVALIIDPNAIIK